jgi:hypothetical protein
MVKNIAWIALGVIAAYVLWWIVPKYFQIEDGQRSQEHLSRIAAEINRGVPVMIDKETELMPTSGHEGMLIYNYRLVSYSVKDLDWQRFAAGARDRLVQNACSQTETREDFLKKGVTLRYSYFDKHKQHIATIDVTPKDCGFLD